jgi:hypothetical protein
MSITLFLVVDIHSVRLNTRFACFSRTSCRSRKRGRRVADSFVAGYQKRGPGRPKGSKNKRGIIIVGGNRKRRRMSAAARAKISSRAEEALGEPEGRRNVRCSCDGGSRIGVEVSGG